MPLLYPTSCKCSTESFVNSASPFPLLFFFDFLFFLESKGSKRKSIAGKLFFCAFGGLANVQHKTDGSHTSRPFFRCKLDVRENAFCPKCTPPPLRLLFLFFKKRNRSPSFLFRRKEAKESHLPDLLLRFSTFCAILLRKTDGSHTSRPFFRCKLDVRENAFSTLVILSRFVFCFFSSRKEIVPLLFFLEEKKSFPKRNRTPLLLRMKKQAARF